MIMALEALESEGAISAQTSTYGIGTGQIRKASLVTMTPYGRDLSEGLVTPSSQAGIAATFNISKTRRFTILSERRPVAR